MIDLLVAIFCSYLCPSETSWVEYDHDAHTFVGVCGDAEGQVLPAYRVQNHTLVVETRTEGMCGE